jgi:8-oxo-dGTP pyrophosphatase MutT (NUDIX family)
MNWNFCPSCGTKDSVVKQDDTNYECTNCGWHHWNNAKGAVALAFVKNGELLISKRGRKTDPNLGKYELPGGFIDFGESAYDASIREAKEELGVTIARDALELLDVYYNDFNVASKGVFSIDLVFLVHRWQGKMQPQDDVADVFWKPFDFIYDDDFCQKFYTGLDKKLRTRLEK